MSRLAFALMVLLAAGACGREQDPTMAGPVPPSSPTTATSAAPPATVPPPDPEGCTGRPPGPADDLTLAVSHTGLRSGTAVTWTLTVSNGGDGDLELVFGSGQDGDVALTADGEEVYRWSDGMAFTQAVRCQVIGAGEIAVYELPQPVLEVEPGEYQLRASVASQPKPFDVATAVTVEG